MSLRTAAAFIFATAVQARFGQEQGNGAIAAISALSDLGQSGQAATLAGGSIQFLLAAANPCGKLQQADQIIAELGTSDRAIAAARGLVAAEQNFNPFVVSIPSICSDTSLPATAELRGVVPLIDPAVVGSDLENANSATSVTTPFSADGLSVAQVMVANGFSNFTAVALDGTKQDASSLGTDASADSGSAATTTADAAAATTTAASVETSAAVACGGTITTTVEAATTVAAESTSTAEAAATTAASSDDAASSAAPAVGSGAVQNDVTGNFDGFVASTISGLDFGICVPTMKFEAGLNGRKDTESTFQAIDPTVNKGQQEALNPAIIMNRIHDQLTNVCGANQAAKDAAAAAQTQVVATGTRDVTTAEMWNTLLGFDGADTNPDQAPKAGLVGHT
ncbi:hypothetical protein NKR23_g3698 [Pleurostoma richardsiae]|uniref:Circumsporozoite protein n=1 Tax=Pleurostoma richardsiae TaxID=41990 RepID=A0AA38VTC5_9PEZI|nr:hypothetical protein NKR23_g3698 [Pleurostoma richardsiae]